MFVSTLVLIHICTAVTGLLAGTLSMLFRKGSGLHRATGNVFTVSMMTMSSSAAFVAAFFKSQPSNVAAGVLTFYLVTTGWRAGRRKTGGTDRYDVAALIAILCCVAGDYYLGVKSVLQHQRIDGVPNAVFFVFGSIALLLAASDIRMFARGGVIGAQRLARHLWRMGLAFMIGVLSLYPGRPQVFPKWLRASNLLFIPHVLILGSLLLWLARVRRRRQSRDGEIPLMQGAARA